MAGSITFTPRLRSSDQHGVVEKSNETARDESPSVDIRKDLTACRNRINISVAPILGEKKSLREYATPEHVGVLTVFLCSEAAREDARRMRAAWDSGWVAQ